MNPNITIHADKTNELEFIIKVDGASENTDVRFVIKTSTYDLVIHCVNNGEDKWIANVPPFPNIQEDNLSFNVEVIADEYYCCPVSGQLTIMKSPKVQMSNIPSIRRPNITVSIPESVAKQKTLLEFTDMTAENQRVTVKAIRASAKILETASNVLKSMASNQTPVSSQGILSVTEATKNAVSKLEDHIWNK